MKSGANKATSSPREHKAKSALLSQLRSFRTNS